ncbi:MAG: LruC domain-containing protein [Leptospiraceae bacterium]|nr:LruC domain-containing protein [Leptospiraceae bacterium]MCP5494802.1 LruC domain-containing protein [Leptospiraceae bacterium]
MKNLISVVVMILILVACSGKKKGFIPIMGVLALTGDGASAGCTSGEELTSSNGDESDSPAVSDTQVVVQTDLGNGTTEDFTYQSTLELPVEVNVLYDNGTPIPNAYVTINKEISGNPLTSKLTDENGIVNDTLTVDATQKKIYAVVSIGDSVSTQKEASIPEPIIDESKGTITISKIIITFVIFSDSQIETQITDRDGDGVNDVDDAYPDDSSKSATIRFPEGSVDPVTGVLDPKTAVHTISFEDLYPNAGDADLNDYTVQLWYEEDLNSQGKIVEIRGYYQHVAHGAGYVHNFKLKLPSNSNISTGTVKFGRLVTDASGTLLQKSTMRNITTNELSDGLLILEDSDKTIPSSNVKGEEFKPGYISKIRLLFSNPIDKQVLGKRPYDLFIYVKNTKQNIHFPGRYTKEDGSDKFVDKNKFPFAIMVPGVWAWPYERCDIRITDVSKLDGGCYKKSVTGYENFKPWAESLGGLFQDWYNYVVSDRVYYSVFDKLPSKLLEPLTPTSLE